MENPFIGTRKSKIRSKTFNEEFLDDVICGKSWRRNLKKRVYVADFL